jgi:hypothetical protein
LPKPREQLHGWLGVTPEAAVAAEMLRLFGTQSGRESKQNHGEKNQGRVFSD